MATYTDDLLALERGPWGIAGVSLQRPDQRDRLAPQGGLYTTLQRDGHGTRARIIGCLRRVIVAREDPAALVTMMAAPETHIVSLTITEKGYCHDPATGRLDTDHPDIAHDRARPDAPRSAVGLIAAALRARRDAGLAPFTVLCCDNLPHNGALLAGLVHDFAALGSDALAGWIEAHGAFPSTMVDRIVPAPTPADVEEATALTGLADAAPVSHEPFRQWVIEDRFAGARPAWEKVGAELVADVAPHEHMKLRMLNGAHSALAYLGYLAGHATIPDVVADPPFRAYAEALWEEVIPTIPPPPGTDLRGYARDLLARFGNTAIRHRTWQIAMDGSQKLPQRLLGTIRERLAQGGSIDRARARRRRVDPLRVGHRRAGTSDRRARSAGRAASRGAGVARTRPAPPGSGDRRRRGGVRHRPAAPRRLRRRGRRCLAMLLERGARRSVEQVTDRR